MHELHKPAASQLHADAVSLTCADAVGRLAISLESLCHVTPAGLVAGAPSRLLLIRLNLASLSPGDAAKPDTELSQRATLCPNICLTAEGQCAHSHLLSWPNSGTSTMLIARDDHRQSIRSLLTECRDVTCLQHQGCQSASCWVVPSARGSALGCYPYLLERHGIENSRTAAAGPRAPSGRPASSRANIHASRIVKSAIASSSMLPHAFLI